MRHIKAITKCAPNVDLKLSISPAKKQKQKTRQLGRMFKYVSNIAFRTTVEHLEHLGKKKASLVLEDIYWNIHRWNPTISGICFKTILELGF